MSCQKKGGFLIGLQLGETHRRDDIRYKFKKKLTLNIIRKHCVGDSFYKIMVFYVIIVKMKSLLIKERQGCCFPRYYMYI